MSVFGAYVLKTWCVHLLQVHAVNMQLGELGEAALPLTLAGPARRKQAELYLALLLGAAMCCYYLLLCATSTTWRCQLWEEAELSGFGKAPPLSLPRRLCRQINRLHRSKRSNAMKKLKLPDEDK